MTTRKFNDIEYPVPGINTAIKTLRPGAVWELYNRDFIRWEDSENRNPPTWDEIEDEIRREFEIYNHYAYERDREKAYPELKDQLDMLFHDIKSGNLENGKWVQMIDSIKEKYPKPQ